MGKNIAIIVLGVAVAGLTAYIVVDKRRGAGPVGGAAPYVSGQPNADVVGSFLADPLGYLTGGGIL
jgi:hypothetical protein